MLKRLHSIFGNSRNVGLRGDDGLAILHGSSGLATERIRKKLIKIFKDYDLHITTEVGFARTDFLDLTLDYDLVGQSLLEWCFEYLMR